MDRNQQARDFLENKKKLISAEKLKLDALIAGQATVKKKIEFFEAQVRELQIVIKDLEFQIHNQRDRVERAKNLQMPKPTKEQKKAPKEENEDGVQNTSQTDTSA